MKTYSMDLRERVVAACDARDGTRDQIAARFSVSVSWVRNVLRSRAMITCTVHRSFRGEMV